MKNVVWAIKVPDFNEFLTIPYNKACEVIDSTRLIVEVLWWLHEAKDEFWNSEFSNKLLLDWKYSLVIRYKREKDWSYRTACALSFDKDENGNIRVNQLTWSNDNHVAFRFNSSFNSVKFYTKLIEDTFSKKWVYVEVVDVPTWLENVANWSRANMTYTRLRNWINSLNEKYNLKKAIV